MIEDTLRAIVREEIRNALKDALGERVNASDAARLTVREAAAIAKVCDKTVRKWLDARELTTFRAGHQIRIDRAELDRFMAAGPKQNGELTPEQLAQQHAKRQAR